MKLAQVQESLVELPDSSKKALVAHAKRLSQPKDHQLFDKRAFERLLASVTPSWRMKLMGERNYLRSIGYSRSAVDPKHFDAALEKLLAPHASYRGYITGVKVAVAELKEIFSKADLRMCRIRNEADIRGILSRTDTSAGFTGIVYGVRTKDELLKKTDFVVHLPSLIERAKRNRSCREPIMIGYRTQASIPYELGRDGTKFERTGRFQGKTRMINMVGALQIICEAHFSRPVQDFMGGLHWYCGHKNDRQLRDLIMQAKQDYQYFVSIDQSSFDQTIPNWGIRLVFEVIREAFRNDEAFDEELWEVVIDDFINKVIIDPRNELVYVNHGVPSGSMFTSIVDSIWNYIMLRAFCYDHGVSRTAMFIMGDDNLLFTEDVDLVPKLNEMRAYLERNFGAVMKPEKCSSHLDGRDPEFLSRVWKPNGCWRHPIELFVKLCYPERFRDYESGRADTDQIMISYVQSFPLGMADLDPTGCLAAWVALQKRSGMATVDKYATGLIRMQRMYPAISGRRFDAAMQQLRLMQPRPVRAPAAA